MPAFRSSASPLAALCGYWLSLSTALCPIQAFAAGEISPVVVCAAVPLCDSPIFVVSFRSIRYASARRTCTLSNGLYDWLNASDAATGLNPVIMVFPLRARIFFATLAGVAV
jgi:hypothetical protein